MSTKETRFGASCTSFVSLAFPIHFRSCLKSSSCSVIPKTTKLSRRSVSRSHAVTVRAASATGFDADVLIVGAGISGLSAAKEVVSKGKTVIILEASDGVGGRIRTDVHPEGYLLDRGFQVLIEGYPEVKRLLNIDALSPCRFLPGATVFYNDKFHRVSDPFRRPGDTWESLKTPIGSLRDKLNVGRIRFMLLLTDMQKMLRENKNEMNSLEYLKRMGFSSSMIDRFWRPFLQGIYAAELEDQSSTMLQFVLRMLIDGPISLPANGMGEIPKQVANFITRDERNQILLNSKVESVTSNVAKLADGRTFRGQHVLVATEGHECSRLVKGDVASPVWRSVTCMYFSSPTNKLPVDSVLYLNGMHEQGPVNNVVIANRISSKYAPRGKSLISCSTIEIMDKMNDMKAKLKSDPNAFYGEDSLHDPNLERRIRAQMANWFGSDEVNSWSYLKSYYIPYAQPSQKAPNASFAQSVATTNNIFVCGDHVETPTLNGAIRSGFRAAGAILEAMKQ